MKLAKKLSLNRETLRRLDPNELAMVGGAARPTEVATECNTCSCVTCTTCPRQEEPVTVIIVITPVD